MAEPECGSPVLLDAVVMCHHFVTTGAGDELNREGTALLRRCETGDLVGHTCTAALAEAVHKVMITEACARFGWARAGAVARLRRAPERLAALTAHSQVAPIMVGLGVRCHDTAMADIELAADLSRQYGLLTNDASSPPPCSALASAGSRRWTTTSTASPGLGPGSPMYRTPSPSEPS